ncbi:stage III sporulation protein AG [Acetatifactor aquisgranensis]|uniref:stage III sporulation protein AG n=1 Tax=Acetatifactor aquisgranensis TaxID=2941233 RepID=UPI00203C0108|nr:stage III sporulation protein AG [Acetatifactor aquisgranensis]
MGRDWKKWAMDKGLQKWFRRDNFLILVLTGILLIIIALPTEEKKEQEDSHVLETEKQTEENSKTNNRDSQEQSGQTADADALYAARMEERLTQALSRVAGVGEVQVMITLKASSELVVEKEQPVRRSSTNESDAMGGNRIVSEVTSEENVIYSSDGSLSEPYVVKTLPPQIEGVLVIAEGAGNGTVSRTIVEIAQALFDVEAHKVKVVPMEEAAP